MNQDTRLGRFSRLAAMLSSPAEPVDALEQAAFEEMLEQSNFLNQGLGNKMDKREEQEDTRYGVKVKLATENEFVKHPVYATPGSACFDIFHYRSEFKRDPYELNSRIIVNTGLYFEIPVGWEINIFSRSGHGFKMGISLANGTGIIDSDYRGVLQVALSGPHKELLALFNTLDKNSRIAQGKIVPVHKAIWVPTSKDLLGQTERGEGGLGSTGG